MPTKKKPRPCVIASDDVPGVFNEGCIARLADIAKFPKDSDRQRFADGIREAARMYALAMHKLDATAVRHEISKLHRAAEHREYEPVAAMLEALPPQALRKLTERRMQVLPPRPPTPNRALDGIGKPRHVLRPIEEYTEVETVELKLPSVQDLRDPARREAARDVVRLLCTAGVELVEGRMRQTGRRSASRWETVLYAPRPKPRPPKREAERQYVANLAMAWLEATGKKPTLTARRGILGPFARLVRDCLMLLGASKVDAVNLITELEDRRRAERGRLAVLRREKKKGAVSPQQVIAARAVH